jgi:sulfopropanediol 3-dehydrogenase
LIAEKRQINAEVQRTVINIIEQIAAGGDKALRELSTKFDRWDRDDYRLSEAEIEKIVGSVLESVKADIKFAQKQIRTFAEAQRATLKDVEIETIPGVRLGHKNIPVNSVGAYVPGGRYPMVASAHMSIVTAKVAGVPRVATTVHPRGERFHR